MAVFIHALLTFSCNYCNTFNGEIILEKYLEKATDTQCSTKLTNIKKRGLLEPTQLNQEHGFSNMPAQLRKEKITDPVINKMGFDGIKTMNYY